MKKENIIAIVFGVLMGGILAVFIVTKNKQIQLEKNKTIAPTEKAVFSQKISQVKPQSFAITKPKDGIIVNKDEINIAGKGEKDSLVVIQSPIKDVIFKIKENQFSVNFPLALGENVIKVVIYPQDKRFSQQEKELRVYYLEEQL